MALKPITLNTPAADKAHIFAEDDAAIYESILGSDGVFSIGERFKATVLSNNKVRLGDGVLNVQGHVARTLYGDYTDLTIENGVSGQNRNDIICVRFTVGTDADSFDFVVKKGTAGKTATDPAITQGNLYNGSKIRELPLYRVKIEGLSIVKVEQMFKVNRTNKELEEMLDEVNSNLATMNKKTLNRNVFSVIENNRAIHLEYNIKTLTSFMFLLIVEDNLYYVNVSGQSSNTTLSNKAVTCVPIYKRENTPLNDILSIYENENKVRIKLVFSRITSYVSVISLRNEYPLIRYFYSEM